MNDDVVIKVEGVSKKYCRTIKHTMLYGATDLARSFLGMNQKTESLRDGEFWALDNINFELKKGETLGIIGVNGSGKSTLLKMLNGIFMPDRGKIEINGKVGALIEVGAGFHPMLTGRENIYINGAILGMSKEEIDSKFDEIIDFADIGEFIDSPVKHYSSGMYVRLGFAIAVHCEPNILLVDEVLSVGDMNFRNKSLKKMSEYKKEKSVIFISHNLDQVQYLCQKTVVLDNGKIAFIGESIDAIRFYETNSYLSMSNKISKISTGQSLNMGVKVIDVLFNGISGREAPSRIINGTPMKIDFIVEIEKNFSECVPHFVCTNDSGTPIWLIYSNEYGLPEQNYEKGKYKFSLELPGLYLREGIYTVNFTFRSTKTFETFERQANVGSFFVQGDINRQRDAVLLSPTAKCLVQTL